MKKQLSELTQVQYEMMKDIGLLYEIYPEATGTFSIDNVSIDQFDKNISFQSMCKLMNLFGQTQLDSTNENEWYCTEHELWNIFENRLKEYIFRHARLIDKSKAE